MQGVDDDRVAGQAISATRQYDRSGLPIFRRSQFNVNTLGREALSHKNM